MVAGSNRCSSVVASGGRGWCRSFLQPQPRQTPETMPRPAQLTSETKLRPVQVAVILVLWVVQVQLASETKLLPLHHCRARSDFLQALLIWMQVWFLGEHAQLSEVLVLDTRLARQPPSYDEAPLLCLCHGTPCKRRCFAECYKLSSHDRPLN